MANWMTIQKMAQKYGIDVSVIRGWANLGYVVSSRIDSDMMIDDDSLSRYLDAHKNKGLSEGYLEKIIKEKVLEREVLLSRFEDELFLLKTQALYQPLFHTLIQELGGLITDNRLREIFLAISHGEPISRVAVRYQMTYAQTVATYSSILRKLGEHPERIATYRNRVMNFLFGKYGVDNPLNIPLEKIVDCHAQNVLKTEAEITTVRDLLQYTSENGWNKLKNIKGMGKITYEHVIKMLYNANFIMVSEDKSITLSPEIAAMVI